MCASVLLTWAACGRAGDRYWQCDPSVTGGWFEPTYWLDGVPGSSDTAYVDNGGTALISDPAQTARASRTYVGYNNVGEIVHDEGVASLGYMFLGQKAGSLGTYRLTGAGDLHASWLHVGGRSEGRFYHSGGSLGVSGIVVGWNEGYTSWNPSTDGLYEIGGSASITADVLYVGTYGTGTFRQTGGTVSVRGEIYAHPNGVVEMSGGDLSVNRLEVTSGAHSTVVHSGGAIEVATDVNVGMDGADGLSYELTGTGVLRADTEDIGWRHVTLFRQSGGTNQTNYMFLRQSGTYELTGGELRIARGATFEGTLDFQGQPGTLVLGDGCFANFGQGAISQGGQATLTTGTNSLVIFPPEFDPAEDLGQLNCAGLWHVAGNTLAIPAGFSIEMYGDVADHVVCAGTITHDLRRGMALTEGIEVVAGGTFCTADVPGDLTVRNAVSGISGGAMYCGHEHIGSSETVLFRQTGGLNLSDRSIHIASLAGADATYEMSGGEVSVKDDIYVGKKGHGHFIHTGGTVRGSVWLAYQEGGSGTYELSGSGDLQGGDLTVGSAGPGLFRQTGGQAILNRYPWGSGGILRMGYGGHGTYELLDGTLSAYYEEIGFTSVGIFRQTGGTNEATEFIEVGCNSAARGEYELSGSGEVKTKDLVVGRNGKGYFTQTGGTVDASGSVIIGKSGGGTGQYTMGGGKLTAQKVVVRKGTLTVAGPAGEVLLADYEQQATATLESEITGGGIALIDISGQALLDGAWSVVDSHSRYGRFEILRALGGIEGTFSSVTLPDVP
ncbi:MAG TPA: hypothetical protein VMZ50_02515, partial [Phycisphaerae bacterium]|nr:hypothetical protein [Phycisphaerae bacterium]